MNYPKVIINLIFKLIFCINIFIFFTACHKDISHNPEIPEVIEPYDITNDFFKLDESNSKSNNTTIISKTYEFNDFKLQFDKKDKNFFYQIERPLKLNSQSPSNTSSFICQIKESGTFKIRDTAIYSSTSTLVKDLMNQDLSSEDKSQIKNLNITKNIEYYRTLVESLSTDPQCIKIVEIFNQNLNQYSNYSNVDNGIKSSFSQILYFGSDFISITAPEIVSYFGNSYSVSYDSLGYNSLFQYNHQLSSPDNFTVLNGKLLFLKRTFNNISTNISYKNSSVINSEFNFLLNKLLGIWKSNSNLNFQFTKDDNIYNLRLENSCLKQDIRFSIPVNDYEIYKIENSYSKDESIKLKLKLLNEITNISAESLISDSSDCLWIKILLLPILKNNEISIFKINGVLDSNDFKLSFQLLQSHEDSYTSSYNFEKKIIKLSK